MMLAASQVKQQAFRRTKIICTIGPASENIDCIRDLIREGMSVARINFSHCKYDEALERVRMLRAARKELDVPLAIMLDTKGPEVRMFGYTKPVLLAKDDTLYRESAVAMANLREVFEKMNKGQGTVGKLINDESLYKNVKVSLQKLDKATEGLEDQGPLSVLGIAVQTLF